VLEEEKIEKSGKIKEFVELIEAVKPARFLNNLLFWTGLGRPMKYRAANATAKAANGTEPRRLIRSQANMRNSNRLKIL